MKFIELGRFWRCSNFWGNPENQDSGSKMAPVIIRHMTSSLPVADFEENIYGRTIYPASVIVIASE